MIKNQSVKDRIVVVGGGGYAKLIINTLKKLETYEIIGYTDFVNNGKILGAEYLGDDNVLSHIFAKDKNCKAVIAVGNNEVSNTRQKIFNKLKGIGFELPVIISQYAVINEDVSIGEGTVVLEYAMINVSSKIGKCVMIDTCAIVEHDCIVSDFVRLAVGSIIGGGVEVGDGSIIGVGAKVIQQKKIYKNCLIGAGSIIIKDTSEEGTYFGVPARRIETPDETTRMSKFLI